MRAFLPFATLMLAWAAVMPAQPARKPGAPPRPPAGARNRAAGAVAAKPFIPQRPRPAMMPVDRWNAMPPEQRERALSKLPPERQEKVRNQIARFNSLPEAEQQRLRQRYQRLMAMPPEQQDVIRRQLAKFNGMPQERRQALAREMRKMRDMSPEERRGRFESEDFHERYSPDEQQTIQDLSEYLAPARTEPAGAPPQ